MHKTIGFRSGTVRANNLPKLSNPACSLKRLCAKGFGQRHSFSNRQLVLAQAKRGRRPQNKEEVPEEAQTETPAETLTENVEFAEGNQEVEKLTSIDFSSGDFLSSEPDMLPTVVDGFDEAPNYLQEQAETAYQKELQEYIQFTQEVVDASPYVIQPGVKFSPKFVPKHLRPRTQKQYLEWKYAWEMNRLMEKEWHFQKWDQFGYEFNAYQNDTCDNKFAQINYLANVVKMFDDADYAMGEKMPQRISPWARAEFAFMPYYHEFNENVKKNLPGWTRKWPEFSDEELQMLDDLAGLSDAVDYQEETKAQARDVDTLDSFIDGVLPGMYLSDLESSAGMVDDIIISSFEEPEEVAVKDVDDAE